MTDEPTDETEAQPMMTTFTVTTRRTFEVDIPEQRLRTLLNQEDEETAEEAVAAMFLNREKQYIAPHQKLTGADVQVDETSNN